MVPVWQDSGLYVIKLHGNYKSRVTIRVVKFKKKLEIKFQRIPKRCFNFHQLSIKPSLNTMN